jgi:hypothetical protein
VDGLAHLTLQLKRWPLDQILDRACSEQNRELLVVFVELVYGELEDATAQLCGVRWLIYALLEFDVLVPERVALEVKTNKVSAALKETILLASMFMEQGAGVEGRGQGHIACYASSVFAEIKVNPHMAVETMAGAYDVRG